MTVVAASAQIPPPQFTTATVLPSAGSQPVPLAPGMLISIYGESLGPEPACTGYADTQRRETPSPLRPHQLLAETLIYPTSLCGVQVLIDDAPAGLLYFSAKQINFKVPQSTLIDGTAAIRVVYQGQSSQPLTVKLGLQIAALSLESPAYTGMPIWVHVQLPFAWTNSVQYPFGVHPASLACQEVEVRRDGKLLQRLPNATTRAVLGNMIVLAGNPCGSVGLPVPHQRAGRIPLHLLYRFDQPGRYEVRYAAQSGPFAPQQGPASDWTSIEVRPASAGLRQQWLGQLKRPPDSDIAALLEDYLPSILGIPDSESLALLLPFLYHPEQLVRRYAKLGLTYWPEAEQASAIQVLREKELQALKQPVTANPK